MRMILVSASIAVMLVALVTTPAVAQTDEATFVFISQTGSEYSYTLLGPNSLVWVGPLHARKSTVITGPPGLYGYILDGPHSIQFVGHVTLVAGGRAEVIIDDNHQLTERVGGPASSTEEPTSPGSSYTVNPGDRLSDIAKILDVDIYFLAAANGLTDSNIIVPGQLLQTDIYTVRAGDTLSQIAARLGVAIDDLSRVNDLQDQNVIHVGQKLNIPK